jgi:hypothetical protein
LYRLPVIDVLAWSSHDLVAAVASIVADAERCPDCGVAPDEWEWTDVETYRCVVCQAREHLARQTSREGDIEGKKVRAVGVADRIESVWTRWTLEGRRYFAAHRYDRDRSDPADDA